jgi:hypothetical protein
MRMISHGFSSVTSRASVIAIDGYTRISLPVSELPYPIIYNDFMGRWLVADGIGAEQDEFIWNSAVRYSIAQTQKGRIVVFTSEEGSTNPDTWRMYDDFAAFRTATVDEGRYPAFPLNVVAAVAYAILDWVSAD